MERCPLPCSPIREDNVTSPDVGVDPTRRLRRRVPAGGGGRVRRRRRASSLAGLFVAHMSGNTVRLGVFVGEGDWSLAAQRLVPIIVFTIGVAGGIALVEALRRRSGPRRRLAC